ACELSGTCRPRRALRGAGDFQGNRAAADSTERRLTSPSPGGGGSTPTKLDRFVALLLAMTTLRLAFPGCGAMRRTAAWCAAAPGALVSFIVFQIGPGSAMQRTGRCFASPGARCIASGTRKPQAIALHLTWVF